MKPVTKEEFEGWKQSIMSRWFFAKCEELKRNAEDNLGKGIYFYRNSVERTALTTAENVGFIKGIDAVLDMEPDEQRPDKEGVTP